MTWVPENVLREAEINILELTAAYHRCIEEYIRGKNTTTVLLNGIEHVVDLKQPIKDERQSEFVFEQEAR